MRAYYPSPAGVEPKTKNRAKKVTLYAQDTSIEWNTFAPADKIEDGTPNNPYGNFWGKQVIRTRMYDAALGTDPIVLHEKKNRISFPIAIVI